MVVLYLFHIPWLLLIILLLVALTMFWCPCPSAGQEENGRPFSGHPVSVMKLTALANGDREVSFYTKNPSEFNEIAQAAELLQYELDKNEKERVRWSQDITHDLRTPITGHEDSAGGV